MIMQALSFLAIVVGVGVVGEVSRSCNNKAVVHETKSYCDPRLLVLFSQRAICPLTSITLIQLRTPVMFCSFMLSYESNNYRSSQLSVRYSSGNCYLPLLVLPLPNTLSTSSTCMFQFVLVSGFPNNFIIQVSRIFKKHFYTLEKA